MDTEWPTHHQELTRKTVEELQKRTDQFERGEISIEVFVLILSVLYDTTSGMIDKEVSNLIADLHWELRGQAASRS